MQAVILVGGKGTRLKPLTEKIPKPLVPVHGRPFIHYLFDRLRAQGITDILLCIGHLGSQFRELLGDGSSLGLHISYAEEKELLGTAGAIKNAASLLEQDFLLLNGDTLFDIDYGSLAAFHKEKDALLTFAVRLSVDPEEDSREQRSGEQRQRGVISIDEVGRVLSFEEKPTSLLSNNHYVNGGAVMVSKRILASIPAGRPVSLEREIVPQLINTKTLFAKEFKGYFIDMGTMASLRQLEKDLSLLEASG
ncbi:MAG: NTP transferase domain-containing protein [DPANN group archaeon]|nr:NTP transferase domain-containing protein [DPANN group archaeon]